MIHNIVNISGGKDSTALALLACERETENVRFVFADTGHEHPETYKYIKYLSGELKQRSGAEIEHVRADFSDKFAARREFVAKVWDERGADPSRLQSALDALKPTGNPFLDLCMLKGVFPTSKRRFCTEHLKHKPIQKQIVDPVLESGCTALIQWHGVRADESASRAKMPEKDVEFGQWEPDPQGYLIYRPILKWTAKDVFAMHRRHGVKPNPLYKKGMYRVGCMPCIHSRKAELRAIAKQYPEVFDHLANMEAQVKTVSYHDMGTFFAADKTPGCDVERSHAMAVKEWATGGDQIDLIELIEGGGPACTSVYGLCE
jgi:3'-phosphoadenosine 5'-phosphosulfate sulfotransferase (PAPS reductase)/FAD synthetase